MLENLLFGLVLGPLAAANVAVLESLLVLVLGLAVVEKVVEAQLVGGVRVLEVGTVLPRVRATATPVIFEFGVRTDPRKTRRLPVELGLHPLHHVDEGLCEVRAHRAQAIHALLHRQLFEPTRNLKTQETYHSIIVSVFLALYTW